MIWLKPAENGDMGRFLEIPELEAGKFVDYDGIFGKVVQDVKGGNADVANKMRIFSEGLEDRMDERTSGTFAFGGSNANNRAGAMVEKILGNTGFVWQTERGDGGAAKDYIIGRIIFFSEFFWAKVFKDIKIRVKIFGEVLFSGLTFLAKAE